MVEELALTHRTKLRIGLAGLGAIGMAIARRLGAGIPGLALAAAAARDKSAAEARLAANGIAARMVAVAALPEHCDVIVECAPAVAFCSIAAPAIDAGLGKPLKLFEGSAREGVRGFPANVNVSAALALAGIGPDRTRLEIWADPGIDRNVHRIEVDADSARFSMTIENVPSENPRTGKITALSAIACLRGLVSTLKVGS